MEESGRHALHRRISVIISTIAVILIFAVWAQVNTTTWCEQGHPESENFSIIDKHLVSNIRGELLDEQIRTLYDGIVNRTIVGQQSATFSESLKLCARHEIGSTRILYQFPLVRALRPDAYHDGLLHGPMMWVVVCTECDLVASAGLQDNRL